MCNPLFVMAGMAVITAATSYQESRAGAANAEYQAAVTKNQAIAYGQEAEIRRNKTDIDQRQIDIEKNKMRREFEQERGKNIVALSAGNVDLSSGSPLAILSGNAARFDEDQREIDYQRKLVGWTGDREATILDWQKDVAFSQAGFLGTQAPSTSQSLFGSTLKGAAVGASSYYAAGGGTSTKQKAPSNGNIPLK